MELLPADPPRMCSFVAQRNTGAVPCAIIAFGLIGGEPTCEAHAGARIAGRLVQWIVPEDGPLHDRSRRL